jgi:hypothetical protein
MLDAVTEVAPLLVSVLALVLSLEANVRARRSKQESDRLLISTKKLEHLHEIDRQHTLLLRLRFIVQDELLQFEVCPPLDELLSGERERLEGNLQGLIGLEEGCERQREAAEAVQTGADPALLDAALADTRRLSLHLEKDIEHETKLLADKRRLVETAPAKEGDLDAS